MGIPGTNLVLTPPAHDLANAYVAGLFAATGVSASFECWGPFNVLIYGDAGPNGNWSASVQLERSFDSGTTWIVCGVGGSGQQAVYNTPNFDVSIVAGEPEKGVLYRLHCTAWTSGNVNYRMSATGQAALAMAVSSVI